jgi:linoleate 8R-lipoxygenase / 9,12-octadecadienoate 8-hydroperoxide 8R-isomerase
MIGAAKTHYARSVRAVIPQKLSLPDPEFLFDHLLERKDFTPHPTKCTSLLFYLASIITHDIFRTDEKDDTLNLNSSYLDLSPLYGSNQEEQNTMRTFHDGKLKPDCFSDKRLLSQPPGVGVLLIMFNRWHNHIVTQLALINESGRFTKPEMHNSNALKKYDNDLFQTGRLITCNLYVNIILKDYVRVILNLNRTDSSWSLDPRDVDSNNSFNEETTFGTGNQVSAEFNLVYRWHSALSLKDSEWTKHALKEMLDGKDPDTTDWKEILRVMRLKQDIVAEDPLQRPFANLKRNKDGTLSDNELAKILKESIEDVAGAFGANKIPRSLRTIEILGILRSRKWRVATLNEFRAHFNLKKHETFEDINPDPNVANQLKALYDHPDYVELYVGLIAESAKEPMVPGSGICLGFTTSRAILSDAVALVRGDRFYTTDYTPTNLTHWGYNESNFDIAFDKGHIMYKLILRAFPNNFKPNSVYAHFPFTTPWENELIHKNLDIHHQYDYSEPLPLPQPLMIETHAGVKRVLQDQNVFKVIWGEKIEWLMSHNGLEFGKNFMLSGDKAENAKSRCMMGKGLYHGQWHDMIRDFYTKITEDLLKRHSTKFGDQFQVDIIRDVINLAQAHFAAEVFCIPIKTEANPNGIYSEHEAYMVMALVFTCVFFDADPMKTFPLRQASYEFTQQLGELMEGLIHLSTNNGWLSGFLPKSKKSSLPIYGAHMVKMLLQGGYDIKELVWTHILPTAGGMVANQGQLLSQTLDFYLREENHHHWSEIVRLAKLDTIEADEKLARYFMEGARIRASVAVWREASASATVCDSTLQVFRPGDRCLVNLTKAGHDPKIFPMPFEVRLDRPMDAYMHFGFGPHACIGKDLSKIGLTTMLKCIAKLPGLKRMKGEMGQLREIPAPHGFEIYLTEDGGSYWPFPATMRCVWGEEVDEEKTSGTKPFRTDLIASTPWELIEDEGM